MVFSDSGPTISYQVVRWKTDCYEGVGFEGSPRHVFWSRYIEPFLEELCISEIATAVSMARERGVDARLLLPELRERLSSRIRKVYTRMADVDRRLRGKGYPDKVEPRSIEREAQATNQFLDERILAEVAMWKPKPRLEGWYKRNKFWIWLIGTLLSIASIIGGIWAKFG